MPSEHLPGEQLPIVSDEEIDAAIALCGGDPRLALRAVFVAYAMLAEGQPQRLAVSNRRRRERPH